MISAVTYGTLGSAFPGVSKLADNPVERHNRTGSAKQGDYMLIGFWALTPFAFLIFPVIGQWRLERRIRRMVARELMFLRSNP
jgi:hypothetical protein